MPKTFLIFFLIIGYGLNVNGQSLIGNWKRIKPPTKEGTDWGDLEIKSDSTYHIYGDTTLRNSILDYAHEGQEWDGKWEKPDSLHFTLWLMPKGHDGEMSLKYTVIKLTEKNLVLRYWFYKKRSKADLVYLRL
jgi:hypothetical protein